ncbi:MAG: hypothetical protein WCO22_00605 [Betaproteobacteria bacterium]
MRSLSVQAVAAPPQQGQERKMTKRLANARGQPVDHGFRRLRHPAAGPARCDQGVPVRHLAYFRNG